MTTPEIISADYRMTLNVGLVAASLASGCPHQVGSAHAAAFLQRDPGRAAVTLRQAIARADDSVAALRDFRALALGLLADIEEDTRPASP